MRVELVCFPLVAAVYLTHLLVSGYDRFYYDAGHYWQLAGRFEVNGHYSLLAYDDVFRGYSIPLLSRDLQAVAAMAGLGAMTIVKIFGALLAATLGVVVIPRLARRLFPGASISLGRVLALNALIFLYWRDHFDFPLSDFPALLAAAVGLLGLLRATALGYVVAGVGLGLAANMRPAYLPTVIAALAVAALFPLRPWNLRRRSVAVVLVLAGALVASMPQTLINHHQRGSWSPLIPGGKSIAMLQLTQGMLAQKYETYVGPSAGYPQPEVAYLDPSTARVLEEEHVSEITSYGKYARIVLHHPVRMAASYVRHIFNGLDVRYPTPYVRDLGDSSIVLSLLQYTLVFVAIARLLLPEARRALGRIRWAGVIVLVSPCLTAIPGAIEPRFFLPLQILIYMLVCFGPATRASFVEGGLGRRVALAATYAAFLLVCVSLSSATLAQIEHPASALGLGLAGWVRP